MNRKNILIVSALTVIIVIGIAVLIDRTVKGGVGEGFSTTTSTPYPVNTNNNQNTQTPSAVSENEDDPTEKVRVFIDNFIHSAPPESDEVALRSAVAV